MRTAGPGPPAEVGLMQCSRHAPPCRSLLGYGTRNVLTTKAGDCTDGCREQPYQPASLVWLKKQGFVTLALTADVLVSRQSSAELLHDFRTEFGNVVRFPTI